LIKLDNKLFNHLIITENLMVLKDGLTICIKKIPGLIFP